MRAFASKMEADEVDLQRTHWVGCVLGAAEGERIERATRCISVVYVVVVHGGERVGGKVQVQGQALHDLCVYSRVCIWLWVLGTGRRGRPPRYRRR